MTFSDYVERVTSKVRRDLGEAADEELAPELGLLGSRERMASLFESAHLFNLGEARDFAEAAADLREDLLADCAEGVPAPFPNMAVVFRGERGWVWEWHLKLAGRITESGGVRETWLCVDLSEPSLQARTFSIGALYRFEGVKEGGAALALGETTVERAAKLYGVPGPRADEILRRGVLGAILRVALVSHPANFLLGALPKLTPREERKRQSSGVTPVRKRPHVLVVDPETLARLSRDPAEGSRPSPLPHPRRGHWMRLSERCRAARAEGRERVWRREAYVGPRDFEDERNRYTVLPFPEKPHPAVPEAAVPGGATQTVSGARIPGARE